MYKRSFLGAVLLLSLGLACNGKIGAPGGGPPGGSSGGGAVGGGPTPADNMMKAAEPGPVRDRLQVLPEHRRGDGHETDGAPHAHAARPYDEDAAPRAREDDGDDGPAARSPPDELRIRRQPLLHARQLHALHEVGRGHHRQRPRQPGQRHRLRRQQQRGPLPPDRGQGVRGPRRSAGRWRTPSSRVTPTCSPPASPQVGLPDAVGGSGRRHAHLAQLRLPRRGADRRVGVAAARAAAAADELHAGRRAARDGGPVVRRARRQPRQRPTPSR